MAEDLFSCESASIAYRDAALDRWRLEMPEFRLRTSDLCLLSGDNMSGKSTFLKFASGFGEDIVLTGAIRRSGRSVSDPRDLADLSVMLSSDDHMFPELTILENITLGVDPQDVRPEAVQAIEALLGEAGVFKERSLRTPLGALSSGGRAVVKFGRAVVSRRAVVLMDEVSSFLDEARAKVVLASAIGFAQAGRAVIMVSHSERDRRFVEAHYPVRRFYVTRHLDRSVLAEMAGRDV